MKRIIPIMQIKDRLMYKSKGYHDHVYVGDPLNALRIFNEKGVDELIVIDIGASHADYEIDFEFLEDLASEAFMPLAYGGRIRSLEDATRVISIGFEKVVLNSGAFLKAGLIESISSYIGAQSVVLSVDIGRKGFFKRHQVLHSNGKRRVHGSLQSLVDEYIEKGIGELFFYDMARDGKMDGLDPAFLNFIRGGYSVPTIVAGGVRDVKDFSVAFDYGHDAVGVGSAFVYAAKGQGVLIDYFKGNYEGM